MLSSKEKGDAGEDIAVMYLEKRGWVILARNYHTRRGEVDIIAEKDGTVAFAEVKRRAAGRGAEAVNPAKARKIKLAALKYMADNPRGVNYRFDIIEVSGRDFLSVNHIENAFWWDAATDGEYFG